MLVQLPEVSLVRRRPRPEAYFAVVFGLAGAVIGGCGSLMLFLVTNGPVNPLAVFSPIGMMYGLVGVVLGSGMGAAAGFIFGSNRE